MPTKMQKLVLVFKGLANEHRMEILDLLAENEGLSLWQIAEKLGGNLKTTSEHCRRLHLANLIQKKYQGRNVIHRLTYLGRGMLSIARRTKNLV